MTLTNGRNAVNHPPPFSVEGASELARKLVELESKGSDTPAALSRIQRRYGLRPNTIEHLRMRRAKSVDISLFGRLRAAYLDACERMASRLLTEIELVKAGTPNDLSEDLHVALHILADQVADLRQQVSSSRASGLNDGQEKPR